MWFVVGGRAGVEPSKEPLLGSQIHLSNVLRYLIISPTECARDSGDKRTQEAICADQAAEGCGLTRIGDHDFDSWRLFLLTSTVPAVLAMFMVAMQNESPRWLMLNGWVARPPSARFLSRRSPLPS